ncbi:hypothetical protein DL95DRAFT_92125 [Leptodontidium sp. 2 PMI_412]|nr:hypothetical protein DL95DRAFT_92125 [Leptodontidium sp. 2 PMI_412]
MDQRTRPATSAVNPATSPVIAKTLPLRVLDVVAVDSNPVVDPKSATSAPRLVTLLVTAPRLADMVADSAAARADMAADAVATEVDKVARPATPAEDTDTCPVTAPKAKSATTVARSAISQETALLRTTMSVPATSASSQVTFKLNAQTKSPVRRDTLRTDE